MKKVVTILLSLSIAAAAFAQPQGGKQANGKQFHENSEKLKAEKIAFITTEVGLTVDEAQAFWPVYNEIDAKQQELIKAEREAFRALNKALRSGEGDVQALLDNYLKAKEANVNLHVINAKKYQKVLSVEKTAKFFTCDEKFRRQQIGKLNGGQRKGFNGQGEPGRDGRKGFNGAKEDGSKGFNGPGRDGFKGDRPGKDFQPDRER